MTQVLSMKEVAELLGLTYKVLWYRLAVGKLQGGVKKGRSLLFDQQDVESLKSQLNDRKQKV